MVSSSPEISHPYSENTYAATYFNASDDVNKRRTTSCCVRAINILSTQSTDLCRRIYELKKSSLEVLGTWGQTLLLWTAACGYKRACKLLFQAGLDPNKQDRGGIPPFFIGCISGHKEVCDIFIQFGVDINKSFFDITPIFMTVQAGQVQVCRLLLERGASISTQTEKGISPYGAIKLFCPSKKDEIKKVFKEVLKPCLFAEAKEYNKEFFIKKLIANIVELSGTTSFILKSKKHTYNSVELEESNNFLMLDEVGKNIKLFSNQFSNILDIETATMLKDVFQSTTAQKNIFEQITSWKNGKPLILATGYVHHAVTVVLWDKFFILCDRNQDLKAYSFKKEAFTAEIAKRIINIKESNKQSYLNFFLEELPNLLKFSDNLNALTPDIGRQKMGNCAYASAEGSVLPLLILNSCRKAGLDISDCNDKIAEITKEQTKIYENWKVFHRLTVLQKYYKRCLQGSPIFIPDTALLSRAVRDESFAKSLPDLSARLDPQLLSQWQNFYNEYCKTL